MTILESYGPDSYDHEGYAAQVLNDGSITGTYSDETEARMVGEVVAACGCGWAGTTRYPCPEPFNEAAHDLALAEWEADHARPALAGARAGKWDQLRTALTRLAGDAHSLPDARLRVRLLELAVLAERLTEGG